MFSSICEGQCQVAGSHFRKTKGERRLAKSAGLTPLITGVAMTQAECPDSHHVPAVLLGFYNLLQC